MLHLAYTPEANEFLAADPFALLTAMLLDQQIPMEKAFTSPHVLAERMGVDRLDPAQIANYDAEQFEELFRTPPALHRFPAAMAKRVQELARVVVERYDGDTASIWSTAESGQQLVDRVAGLPGFGDAKSRIFAALLGKQFSVQPDGWQKATGAYGEPGTFRSVADVVDDPSLQKVRAYKKEMKATARAGG
jgi:uncharacterized HhH-GPD family protein